MTQESENQPANPTERAETPTDEILHRLLSSREKMPHNPRWMAARQRTLWHYVERQQEELAEQQKTESEKGH